MNAILKGFGLLDEMNATMVPERSAKQVAALGELFADYVVQLGRSLLQRYPAGAVANGHPILAIWAEIEGDRLKARLSLGTRESADWSKALPADALLVPFHDGLDHDGVPIGQPTLHQIGRCLGEEPWQICFRSAGFIRMLIMFAESRHNKEGVAA
ncbi:hypothetical protein [Rhizobium sp.]|uniref:hypothetical protein n=1 Tax=Rhizobium sp. TaxID=391 RepID=UPI0028A7B242